VWQPSAIKEIVPAPKAKEPQLLRHVYIVLTPFPFHFFELTHQICQTHGNKHLARRGFLSLGRWNDLFVFAIHMCSDLCSQQVIDLCRLSFFNLTCKSINRIYSKLRR